ncbi:metallophosphoesterase family protein [Paenibacillus sp. OV219]|uniref:metallophosphoesterase family protein n=1 Tax=Paenibacillus sp. OV219 TaxID=1884377 RepID=UPI0008C38154|nr:3',5'-cyclic AMP phosphodiesterase CpdA [Paenibacillus sp. OV219]
MTQKKSLSFRNDGTFKIVQFTDLHWSSGALLDMRTHALMQEVLQEEKPDLVVFTGDIVYANYSEDPKRSFLEAVSCVESAQIPWAAVYGNHDTEKGVTREELMELQMECDYCLSEPGPEEIFGVGNFVLPVLGSDGETAFALYFLDSGSNAPASVGGYDWIRPSQISWYMQNSNRYAADYGEPLPSLAFFHIPIPEYKQVWDEEICCGVKYEDFMPPLINSGFGAAMLEQKDMLGTFAGHDHINDFYGDWYGIRLCYGRGSGYNAYGMAGFARGARIVQLREGVRDFETWIRLEGNIVEREQPIHVPEKDRNMQAASVALEDASATEWWLTKYRSYYDSSPIETGPVYNLVSTEMEELARLLAPELHLAESEPFTLRDCVAVFHPEQPLIAYHLFWDREMERNEADHQLIWVSYHPETKELSEIKTYFHENMVSSHEALEEAKAQQNRPQVYIQWGIHGAFLTGGIRDVTVSRLVNGILITNTGLDSLTSMFSDALRGRVRGVPLPEHDPLQPFSGQLSDYMNFSKEADTRDFLNKENRVLMSKHANTAIRQIALDYRFVPMPEWPEDCLSFQEA